MNNYLFSIIVCLIFASCSHGSNLITPSVQKAEFPGFDFSGNDKSVEWAFSGYEYQTRSGDKITFDNCRQVYDTDKSKIAAFDYFRFRLLLTSCSALDQFSSAGKSIVSYFPSVLSKDFYEQLPALVSPLYNKTDFNQRHGKSIIDYDKTTEISIENPYKAKLLTTYHRMNITVLARGDFSGDDVEDMLVKVMSYTREARGKRVDSLILTKKGKGLPVKIHWRLFPVEK